MLTIYAYRDRILRPAPETALHDAVWIDLVSPTPDEIATATRATGFSVPSQASVSEIQSSSRLATRDGVLYLTLPLIAHGDDGPRGVAAGFVLSEARLLTVRFSPSQVFDGFSIDTPEPKSTHILVALLEAVVGRLADALEQVAQDLDAISHRIFAMGVRQGGARKQEDAELRVTLGQLGRLGDLISHIRDSLVGAARIGPYVETAAVAWLPPDIPVRLRTLQQDIASLSDFDTHLNDKLQFLLDATMGFINIAQNTL